MTNTFLEQVAQDLNTRFKGDFRHVSIIFNNRRPSRYLQKYLADIVRKTFWSPKFFTIQEFFGAISRQQIAAKNIQCFVLYQEMQAILHTEGIENRWPKFEDFLSIAETLLSDFGQIQRELVSAEDIFKELREISEIDAQFSSLDDNQIAFLQRFWGSFSQEKQQAKQEEFIKMWRRMPQLFQNFHQKLTQLGFCTEGQIYASIAQNLENIGFDKNEKWIFVGFNALSAAEIKAFKYWQTSGLASFYFDSDEHYINDTLQEAGLFMRKNKDLHQLQNVFPWDNHFLQSNKELSIYAAKGQTVQCTLLQDVLLPLLKSGQKLSKTAIVLLDEQMLLPALQHIPLYFPKEDDSSPSIEIPVNISMGLSIKQNNIFNFLDNWVELQKYYLTSGQKKVYQAPHLIVQSFLWNKFSGCLPQKRGEISDKIIKHQHFYVPITVLEGDIFSTTSLYFQKANDGQEAIALLKDIIQHAFGMLSGEREIRKLEWDTVKQLQKQLENLEAEMQEWVLLGFLSAKEWRLELILELWKKNIQQIQVSNEAFEMDALQIIGLLETRSLDFENLIFLGANEGILPQTSSRTTFIPDSIRRAYGLPVSENLDAVSAYMFYRLLQRAKNINIIYNSHTDENNSGEISRFIRQIEYELPYQIHKTNTSYNISTPKSSHITIQKDVAVQKVLQEFLQHKSPISPSAFTLYLNCPLQYYFKYIAKIKEPEVLEESIPAAKIGSILHKVMEKLYKPYEQKSITEADFETIQSKAANVLHESFNQILFENINYSGKLTGSHEVVKTVIKRYIELILEHDKALAPLYILGLENEMRFKYEFQKGSQKASVLLYGIIDRVDMLDQQKGKIRIVDYKTGREQLEFQDLKSMFDPQKDEFGKAIKPKTNKALIQTLIYSLMYESQNGFLSVEPNLYLLRQMQKNSATSFLDKNQKQALDVAHFPEMVKEFKTEFHHLFSQKIAEMFDENVPYTQTPFEENCSYCAYRNICGR